MITAETAIQNTNGFDVLQSLIGLGGPILVAVASVVAILISNSNAAKMKKDDYRREEISQAAEAIAASMRTIGYLFRLFELIEELPIKFDSALDGSPNLHSLGKTISINSAEVPELSGKLALVAFGSPDERIRKVASKVDFAIKEASAHGSLDARWRTMTLPSVSKGTKLTEQAKVECQELQNAVYLHYHPAPLSHG